MINILLIINHTVISTVFTKEKRYLSTDMNEPKYYNKDYITDNNFNESYILKYKLRKSSTNKIYDKKSLSLPIYVCQNCFDKEMLEEKRPSLYIDNRKEILREQFIKQNPYYFIDKMNNFEKEEFRKK